MNIKKAWEKFWNIERCVLCGDIVHEPTRGNTGKVLCKDCVLFHK